MKIKLTDDDRKRAKRIVFTREHPKRIRGIPQTKIEDGRSGKEVDYMGALAEIAMAKMFGIFVPHKIRLDGDDGYDMVINGKTIDVKFSFYSNCHLFVNEREDIIADVYTLFSGDDENMFFLGAITGGEFLEGGETKNFGYGNRVAIPRHKLHGLDWLENFLGEDIVL